MKAFEFEDVDSGLYKAKILIYDHAKYSEAKKMLSEVAAMNPENAEVFVLMAYCEAKCGNASKADDLFKQSFRLNPEFAHAYYLHALVLCDRNKHNKALQSIHHALSLEPENDEFLSVKALIHYFENDLSTATHTLYQGLKINPNNQSLLRLHSLCLVSKQKSEEAEQYINKSLQLGADNSENLRLKGLMHFNRKEYKLAEQCFISSLKSDPNNELAREGLTEVKKHQWPLLNFFINFGFQKYTFKFEWNIGSIILLLIGIKGLPIWLGLFTIYLLICWYFDVLYETVMRLAPVSKYLLTTEKIKRSNWFLLLNGICIALIFLSYLITSDIIWVAFVITLCSIFFMSSYFASWRTKTTIMYASIFSIILSLLSFIGGGLLIFCLVTIALTSLYGLLWSFRVFGD